MTSMRIMECFFLAKHKISLKTNLFKTPQLVAVAIAPFQS